MKYVPSWIAKNIMSKKFKCHDCQISFDLKCLKAVGIRDSFTKSGQDSFYMEFECSKCKRMTFFEMQEMNVIEFSEYVLSEIPTAEERMEDDMFLPESVNDDIIDEIEQDYEDEILKFKELEIKKSSKITQQEATYFSKVIKSKGFTNADFLNFLGFSPDDMSFLEKGD